MPPLAVAVPLLGAAVVLVAGRWLPRAGSDAFALGWAGLTAGVLGVLWHRAGDGAVRTVVGGWEPGVGITLHADRLGAGLALLAAVLVVAVLAYSWRYFDEPPREHTGAFPALVLLFEGGMVGFALTGDLFNAFVFFELMGVAAYALTGYRIEDPRPLHGALTFGVINSIGGYATLLGIGLIYGRTGELGMARVGVRLAGEQADALLVCAFVLLLTGMLVKAAAVPFHFWLPDAHAVAPTPVCMLLSGVMVELGVYGTYRIQHTVFEPAAIVPASVFRDIFLVLGVLTALLGAVMCWQQRHLKRLLAYSTVAHTGLFLTGVALVSRDALSGTALYIAGHAAVKAALFGLVGVLLDRHGSVDEHRLHGRGRGLRTAGAAFACGGLALAGMPPFAAGLGKAAAEHAAGVHHPWVIAVYVAVSALTGGAVLRAGLRVFYGAGPRPELRPPPDEMTGSHEPPEIKEPVRGIPPTMTGVPVALVAACLVAGLLPYAAPVPGWTPAGVLLGLLSTTLAAASATAALRWPAASSHVIRPPARLHSGRVGDYVAWLTAGMAVLTVVLAVRV
nr:proton-conducting transporter membrane subunit [Streptomyces coryli]